MIKSIILKGITGALFLVMVNTSFGRLQVDDTGISNSSSTNEAAIPELGQIPTPAVARPKPVTESERLQKFQLQLDLGREQRHLKNDLMANETLSALLQTNAPEEIQRLALFELALVAQDENKLVRAEQIFGQYLKTYPDDSTAPEVIFRQGIIYRQMGVDTLAVSKFYAVMSTALRLKLQSVDYYKKIVLQAQFEIADTYYQQGNYDEAGDFFSRLIKSADPDLDQAQIHYKLARSLSYSTNYMETVAQAQIFLDRFTNSVEVPEVRFFLASSLKKMGRNSDSLKQVLLLLQSQEPNAQKHPEVWIYWQQRAGNEIANQLYKEGDYLSALQIYLSLAALDKSPAWQMPVWYQTALVYEQLQQWQKATAMYLQIIDRQKDLIDSVSTPSLVSLVDMAKWRKDYIDWMQKAKLAQQTFALNVGTNTPTTTVK